ncbi:MAG TPA: hypothetical protein PL037_08880, partial [Elusimicrobiales bacterium]|nr:hypothetical protein [Elusimicrobiales bacterium]
VPAFSARLGLLLAAVPAAELFASAADKLPAGPRLAAMAAGLPAAAPAVSVCAAAALCALAFRFRPGRAAFAWTVLLSGAAVSVLLRYRLIGLGREDLVFLSLWLMAASAWPLLSLEFAPAGGKRPLLTLALVPLLVALAHAPKYSFWASELKRFDGEDWTADAGLACAALNASPDGGSVYIHNRLDRRVSALAAMCRRRMYASPWLDAVWGDGKVYAEALSDASDFFTGKVADPCRWLRSRGIGYVLWDAAGAGPEFPVSAGRMGFLDTMYRGDKAALYSVGRCEVTGTGRPARRME